ncbi:MAG: hypothetical protein P4L87_11080 [Formivibrio sp.]|nr:hypothetical protein [Formivibrio sp.]
MPNTTKIWMFLRFQALLVAGCVALVWGLKGLGPALSAACGGAVALIGGVIYALILSKVGSVGRVAVLHLHLVAEIAKLCGMFAAVVILFVFYRQANWIWVFAGLLVAYSAYWFGLLIKI